WRPRVYQHIARRVEAEGHSRDRPHARRNGYRDLEHAVAESAKAQNDVRRNRRPYGGRGTAIARKRDRRKNRGDALKRRAVGKLTRAWREHPIRSGGVVSGSLSTNDPRPGETLCPS